MVSGYVCGSRTGKWSEWFPVEQGLHQGCVLAPLLFNISFKAVTHMAFTRVQSGQRHHGRASGPQRETGDGEAMGVTTAGEAAPAMSLWDMLIC